MTDVEWLARNVHEWDENSRSVKRISNSAIWSKRHGYGYNKEQWLAERARLQGKPTEWKYPFTEFRRQLTSGVWYEYDKDPTVHADRKGWGVGFGEVLGDWRATLERRPADMPVTASEVRYWDETPADLLAVKEPKVSPAVSVPAALVLRVALAADVNARDRLERHGRQCQPSVRQLYLDEIEDAKALYKLAVEALK